MEKLELINQKIKEIEKDRKIKIILAVDNGSNAYGTNSKNSDIDLRFLYVESLDSYLRLNREKDTYEVIDEKNNIEYKGFSLDKFIKLLSKSNPSILEWLNSPINYLVDNKYSDKENELKELSREYFSLKRCLFHYTGNATIDLKKMKENAELKINEIAIVNVKKYISVFRHLLVCEYIVKNNAFPITTDLETLIKDSEILLETKSDSRDINYREVAEFFLENKRTNPVYEIGILRNSYEEDIAFFNKYIDIYRKIAEESRDSAIDFIRLNDIFVKWVKELDEK